MIADTLRGVFATVVLIIVLAPPAAAQEARSKIALRNAYRARHAAVEKSGAIELRYELAAWCAQQGFERHARRHAGEVLEQDPDHAGAHRLLGHVREDGQWITKKRAMNRRGYAFYRGKWRKLSEIAHLKMLEDRRQRQRALVREISPWVRRLASMSKRTRHRAHQELAAIAKRERLPALAAEAKRTLARYDRLLASGVATIEVRAQLQGPVTFRRFTTSLATGTPVTIELPSSRRVSIGTTVGIPVGR